MIFKIVAIEARRAEEAISRFLGYFLLSFFQAMLPTVIQWWLANE